MAQDKKSFVLYCDLLHVIKKLVEQDRENKTNYAGELFLHILQYVNDESPIPVNFIIDMAFEPIKQQLKRDLRRYEQKQTQRIEAGKRSAEQRKLNEEQRKSTTVDDCSISCTVNGNVNVNDNVNDNVLHKCNDREKEEIQSPEIGFLVPVNLIESYMTSETQIMWFEQYCMNNHMKPEELKTKIQEYVKDLRDKNITEKDKKDLFIHFSNFVNSGKRNFKPSGPANQEPGTFKGLATKRTIKSAL